MSNEEIVKSENVTIDQGTTTVTTSTRHSLQQQQEQQVQSNNTSDNPIIQLLNNAKINISDLSSDTIERLQVIITVQFADEIQFREYSITIGDHPCCKDGLAITLHLIVQNHIHYHLILHVKNVMYGILRHQNYHIQNVLIVYKKYHPNHMKYGIQKVNY